MTTVIEKLPITCEDFFAMPQTDLRSPERTCLMFLCALKLYMVNKEVGEKAINYLRGPRPMTTMEEQFLRDRLRHKPYLPLAYFHGATPSNNYVPEYPYVLNVYPDSRSDAAEEYRKVFLKTEGASQMRPVTLRKKEKKFYLWEYSSLLSDIQIPDERDPWK